MKLLARIAAIRSKNEKKNEKLMVVARFKGGGSSIPRSEEVYGNNRVNDTENLNEKFT